MSTYKGYMFDLDGTVYHGNKAIESAISFIQDLARMEIPYLFVTNNSTRRPEDVAVKLREMGVWAQANHVYTSSMATAALLARTHSSARVFAVGEEGLLHALQGAGMKLVEDQPDVVVMGLDRDFTYEKLSRAVRFVHQGARFYATNQDTMLTTEAGRVAGNGALAAAVAFATQTEPTVVGKPQAHIMDGALEVLHLSKKEVVMVGDNYATDILAGIRAGIDTIHVQTGISPKEEVALMPEQPTFSIRSLGDWIL
ncbi:TIGR01457 family HAD-type hydrolase [Shouchella shacheensis]|uniref:TIGR01457 family HAD-type hydrolase n=1 Tax=Shouchella shacheensis TaxID=1649580 RepID=UPI0007405485|nr:TIGR01457 family HAD-type hydrolase [Shouchella shacheensis]